MKTKLLGLIAACTLLGSTVAANASPYIVTLEEVGSDVVATGSGEIDLTGLVSAPTGAIPETGIQPDPVYLVTGTGSSYAAYTSISGPTSIGPSTSITLASIGTGDLVGIYYPSFQIFVPSGYSSFGSLSDTATYDNATFASLGLTPGTYEWTWGTGADQSFTLEIGTPIPAALPLFATGLGGLGLLGWRRKRKAAAIVA